MRASSRRLSIAPDVIFDISMEGNRPDAWSVEGVARDLATRLRRPLRETRAGDAERAQRRATSFAGAGIDAPDLCGRLTVSVLRRVGVASVAAVGGPTTR